MLGLLGMYVCIICSLPFSPDTHAQNVSLQTPSANPLCLAPTPLLSGCISPSGGTDGRPADLKCYHVVAACAQSMEDSLSHRRTHSVESCRPSGTSSSPFFHICLENPHAVKTSRQAIEKSFRTLNSPHLASAVLSL